MAFGAFHRYIYKPFKTGMFSGSLLHHKLAAMKGALAAAFAYHEGPAGARRRPLEQDPPALAG
ncbi:MAG: hypothetical protein ACR2OB_14845 [Solirubrobacteraceae bacterium]